MFEKISIEADMYGDGCIFKSYVTTQDLNDFMAARLEDKGFVRNGVTFQLRNFVKDKWCWLEVETLKSTGALECHVGDGFAHFRYIADFTATDDDMLDSWKFYKNATSFARAGEVSLDNLLDAAMVFRAILEESKSK